MNRAACMSAVMTLALLPYAAQAGPPFVTDDPEPTEYGHFEIYLFSEGTINATSKEGTALGVEVNYGALPDLQLSASLPANFDAPDREGPAWGVGEAELGAKYRFLHEEEEGWQPQISFYPSAEFALGRSGRNIAGRGARIFLPLWAEKAFGNCDVFGGGGYRIATGEAAQNSAFAGLGVLHRFGESLHAGAEVFHESSEEKGEVGETGFNVGVVYDLNTSLHLAGSLGSKFSDPRKLEGASYYFALEWTI